VPGALFPPLLFVPTSVPRFLLKSPTSPKDGGLGGQSLPELGLGSLPEENQLSRQLSQLENWSAVAAIVRHDGAESLEVVGSRATETQGSMPPPW